MRYDNSKIIGGLLDAWDGISGDFKSAIEFEHKIFVKYINLLKMSVEYGGVVANHDRWHVMPLDMGHVPSLNCWCGPSIDEKDESLIIHYSYDGTTQRHKRTPQDEYS